MLKIKDYKRSIIFILIFFALASCAREGFFKTGDARKNPPDPRERVKKNLEEGKGFRLNEFIRWILDKHDKSLRLSVYVLMLASRLLNSRSLFDRMWNICQAIPSKG